MKITDSEIIKSSEKELIDTITGDLDWSVIEEVFQKEHKLGLQDDVEYRQGDIVIYNNQIAYKIDFDVKVKLSVLFDRNGEYLAISTPISDPQSGDTAPDKEVLSGKEEKEEIDDIGELDDIGDGETSPPLSSAEDHIEPSESVSKMASQIAEMLSDINEE